MSSPLPANESDVLPPPEVAVTADPTDTVSSSLTGQVVDESLPPEITSRPRIIKDFGSKFKRFRRDTLEMVHDMARQFESQFEDWMKQVIREEHRELLKDYEGPERYSSTDDDDADDISFDAELEEPEVDEHGNKKPPRFVFRKRKPLINRQSGRTLAQALESARSAKIFSDSDSSDFEFGAITVNKNNKFAKKTRRVEEETSEDEDSYYSEISEEDEELDEVKEKKGKQGRKPKPGTSSAKLNKKTNKSGKPGKSKTQKRNDDTDSEAEESYDDDEGVSVEPETSKRKPNKTTNKRTQPGRSSKVSATGRKRYVDTDSETEETCEDEVGICSESEEETLMQKRSGKKSKPNAKLGNTHTGGQGTKGRNSGKNSNQNLNSTKEFSAEDMDISLESEEKIPKRKPKNKKSEAKVISGNTRPTGKRTGSGNNTKSFDRSGNKELAAEDSDISLESEEKTPKRKVKYSAKSKPETNAGKTRNTDRNTSRSKLSDQGRSNSKSHEFLEEVISDNEPVQKGKQRKKSNTPAKKQGKRQVDKGSESESEVDENMFSKSEYKNLPKKPQPTNKKSKSESNLNSNQNSTRGASNSKSKSVETMSSQNDSQNSSSISGSQHSATSNTLPGFSPILRPLRVSRNKKVQQGPGSVVLAGDLTGSIISDLSSINESPAKGSKGAKTKRGGLINSTRLPDSRSKSREKRKNAQDILDDSAYSSLSKKSKSSSTSESKSEDGLSSILSTSSVSSEGSSRVLDKDRRQYEAGVTARI